MQASACARVPGKVTCRYSTGSVLGRHQAMHHTGGMQAEYYCVHVITGGVRVVSYVAGACVSSWLGCGDWGSCRFAFRGTLLQAGRSCALIALGSQCWAWEW